ncbi:thioredoxin [Candidatus Dependentiae bacterium]|nr:thioredoxin [Candidatus Dependentiae bacterium]
MKKQLFSFLVAISVFVTFSGCDWFKKHDSCSSCSGHHHHQKQPARDLVQTIRSKAAFEHLIATATKPVVVEFGAHWCGACQEMKPILAEVAAATKDRYIIATVELTEAKELQEELGIKGIPVIYLYKNGKEVPVSHHPTGVIRAEKLLMFLAKHFDKAS